MKTINHLSKFIKTQKTVVTIGTFDGVHLGHLKVIEQLNKASKKKNKQSLILTFFPHPRMILQKGFDLKLINTIDERILLLEKTGLDYLIIHPFDKEFSRLSALDFVRTILVNKLNISKLVIGYDHHFGKNREGSFEELTDYGHTYDFKVKEISALDINDIAVSSTKIRAALNKGDIEKANRYLGYHFMLTGTVVEGNNLGNKIGFPTANLHIKESYKLIPKTGVYVVKSTIDNTTYFGMMNIGFRPTVDGKSQTIEIHFFDFDQNIYGKKIQVDILKYVRHEQKFDSIKSLKKQLHKDQIAAKAYVETHFVKE